MSAHNKLPGVIAYYLGFHVAIVGGRKAAEDMKVTLEALSGTTDFQGPWIDKDDKMLLPGVEIWWLAFVVEGKGEIVTVIETLDLLSEVVQSTWLGRRGIRV